MPRLQVAFGAVVVAQAAHSVEEYVGRLWETFPPARVPGLVSEDLGRGFLVLNLLLLTKRTAGTGGTQPRLSDGAPFLRHREEHGAILGCST